MEKNTRARVGGAVGATDVFLSPPFEMILLGWATCGAPSGRIPAGVGSQA